MRQLIHSRRLFSADHPLSAIVAGLLLSACAFIGASALSFSGPVILAPTVPADHSLARSPADSQAARQHDRIDHSFFLNQPDHADPIALGASIAAYEASSH